MFVLLEAEHGELTAVTKIRRRRPVDEYLRLQGRFAHVFDEANAHELDALRALAERNIRRFDLLDTTEAAS
jgi:pyruvate ferredoxin oxidoreductase beta subunit